ncbi:hypothetical protein HDU96_007310 [Phlyctochytrium bullatum]|nr:hypothetical protein HDU96_007310 [Phlyctochytrium bullatum]
MLAVPAPVPILERRATGRVSVTALGARFFDPEKNTFLPLLAPIKDEMAENDELISQVTGLIAEELGDPSNIPLNESMTGYLGLMMSCVPVRTYSKDVTYESSLSPMDTGSFLDVGIPRLAGELSLPAALLRDVKFQVIYPYEPRMDGEVELRWGEVITVRKFFKDGWAIGYNETSQTSGAFPIFAVEEIEEATELATPLAPVTEVSITPVIETPSTHTPLPDNDHGRLSPVMSVFTTTGERDPFQSGDTQVMMRVLPKLWHRQKLRTARSPVDLADCVCVNARLIVWDSILSGTVLEFTRQKLAALQREAETATPEDASEFAQAIAAQREKLAAVSQRLRIHAIRMVVLLFAIAQGAKRKARSQLRTPTTPSVSISSRGPDLDLSSTAPITAFTLAPHAPSAPSPVEEQGNMPPATPQPLALIPVSRIPAMSLQTISQWRLLQSLDTDSLTGLAVALQASHAKLAQRFVEAGLDVQQAALHAFHAVSLGPKAMGAILGASSGAAVMDLLAANPSLKPGAGPFMFNAVMGILSERGVGF